MTKTVKEPVRVTFAFEPKNYEVIYLPLEYKECILNI